MKIFIALFLFSILTFSLASEKKKSFNKIVNEIVNRVISYEKNKYGNKIFSDSESQDGAFVDQGEFWERYRQHLIGVLTKGHPPPYLQILTTPIDARWDQDPNQLTDICNIVPYWGPYYQQSPYRISDQYRDFIMNINEGRQVKNGAYLNDLQKCKADYENMSQNLEPQRQSCMTKFLQLATKPDFEKYMEQCLGSYSNKLKEKQFECQFYETIVYGIENQDLQESRYEVDQGQTWYEAQGSLAYFRQEAHAGRGTSMDLDVNFFGAVEKPVQWSDIKGIKTPSRLNNGAFDNLVKQPGKGFKTLSSRFQMKMKFKAFTVIRAAPGRWFRHSLIQKYKNGPFVRNSPNYFGNGGSMRLKPTAFYLVYQPELYLYMDAVDHDQFLNYGGKSSSGFFSSKSSYAIIQTSRISSDRIEVKISSQNPNPEIYAIESELLG